MASPHALFASKGGGKKGSCERPGGKTSSRSPPSPPSPDAVGNRPVPRLFLFSPPHRGINPLCVWPGRGDVHQRSMTPWMGGM